MLLMSHWGLTAEMASAAATSWTGTPFVDIPAPDTMRICCLNANGIAVDGNPHAEMWAAMHRLSADAVLLQDHGCTNEALSAVKTQAKDLWTGISKLAWRPQAGAAVKSGRHYGGTISALAGRMASMLESNITDPTGWSRYHGSVLHGKGKSKVALINAYLPCRSDADTSLWQQQKDCLIAEGHPEDVCPWTVAINDLMATIDALPSGTHVILCGDLNVTLRDTGRPSGTTDPEERTRRRALLRACAERGLVDLWDELHPKEVAWTRQLRQDALTGCSQIDHALVSETLVSANALRMGVLTGEAINASDHRLLLLELQPSAAFTPQASPARSGRPKPISLTDNKSISEYAISLLSRFGRDAVAELKILEGLVDQPDKRAQLCEGIERWERHALCLVQAEDDMIQRRDKTSRRRKNCWSPAMVSLLKRLRALQLTLRCAERHHYQRARRLYRAGNTAFGKWIRPPPVLRTAALWRKWCEALSKEVTAQLRQLHGRRRKALRMRMGKWVADREEKYRTAKCKRQLHDDLRRAPRSGPLTSVITEKGDYVEGAVGVKAALTSAFAKWFGAGRQRWYIGKALWREDGGAIREWIAHNVPPLAEGMTEDAWLDSLPDHPLSIRAAGQGSSPALLESAAGSPSEVRCYARAHRR